MDVVVVVVVVVIMVVALVVAVLVYSCISKSSGSFSNSDCQ